MKKFIFGTLGWFAKPLMAMGAIALASVLAFRSCVPDDPNKNTVEETTSVVLNAGGDVAKTTAEKVFGEDKEEFGDRVEKGLNTALDYGGVVIDRTGKVLKERAGVSPDFKGSANGCNPANEVCTDADGAYYIYDPDMHKFCADSQTGKHCVADGELVPRQTPD